MHELAFWSPLGIEGYLAQPRYRGERHGPVSSDVRDFVVSPMRGHTSFEVDRVKVGEQEEWRERGLGLVCKKKKDCF